jgi:hypothetical protein
MAKEKRLYCYLHRCFLPPDKGCPECEAESRAVLEARQRARDGKRPVDPSLN